jgi:hypothetical protein
MQIEPTPPAGEILTLKQLCARTQISRRHLFDLRRRGMIPTIPAGRRKVLFSWNSVERSLLKLQGGATNN